jgi:hypothetical protein
MRSPTSEVASVDGLIFWPGSGMFRFAGVPGRSEEHQDPTPSPFGRSSDRSEIVQAFDRFVIANTNRLLLCGYSSLVTRRNGPANQWRLAMTILSTSKKFTLLTAMLAVSMVLLGALMRPASAGMVDLSGTHSATDIKGHCDAAGGEFHVDPGGYACNNGGNIVTCTDNGKCVGVCPNCGTRQGNQDGKGNNVGVIKPPRGIAPTGPTDSKGKGGITPVPVVGVKMPGSGGQPVTIFARGAGGGGGFAGLHGGRR